MYRKIFTGDSRGIHTYKRAAGAFLFAILAVVYRVRRCESAAVGFYELVPDDYDFEKIRCKKLMLK